MLRNIKGFYPGGVWGIVTPTPLVDPGTIREVDRTKISHEDRHLRSSKKVVGYHIHAKDGDIGHVNNFIVDDQTWQIAYLAVDNWEYTVPEYDQADYKKQVFHFKEKADIL